MMQAERRAGFTRCGSRETVYLIEAWDRFKIGKSCNPCARQKSFEEQYPHLAPMVFRFFAYGTTKEETAIHRSLRGFRVSGMGREWFWRDSESWRIAITALRALPEFNDMRHKRDPFETCLPELKEAREKQLDHVPFLRWEPANV